MGVRLTQRDTILFGVVGILLLIATASAVGSLNRDIFSAKGFVSQYLHALERHDASSALAMPGVLPPKADAASTVLLRNSALGELSEIRILDEAAQPDGTRIVSASYVVGSRAATGLFLVQHTGTEFLFFDTWAFATAPLGTVTVNVLHDSVFDVGTSDLIDLRSTHPETSSTYGATGVFPVLAPGEYTFGHTSSLLTARPDRVVINAPRASAMVTVDVQANAAFNADVQKEVDAFLDECVTQIVLQPTGCPFGYQTGNRLVGEPTWSVVTYPEVTVVAGDTGWIVRGAVAEVELTGSLQSLYDGTITPLDEIIEAPFNLDIVITPDRGLLITVV